MRIAPFLGQLAREIYVIDLVNTQSRKITRHTKNPPQGLSEVWGQEVFFCILVTDPPHRNPCREWWYAS
jgi:hypothetical protein